MEKVINEFPAYRINRNGEIFSCYKPKTAIVTDQWQLLQPVLDKGTGYFLVTLVHSRIRKNLRVHRLLAQHFIANPENKAQVNHIDGNKQNNTLSNLEWVTPKENAQHAVRTGLCDQRIEACSVLVVQLTKDAQTVLAEFTSLHEAGSRTNTAWQNIWKVCAGRRKTAGGYCWKYK